jgi:hypothetical protein
MLDLQVQPACRRSPAAASWLTTLAAAILLAGCASRPAPTRTGFLSSYELLETKHTSRSDYISPKLAEYTQFLIEPVEMRLAPDLLTPQESAEAAEHFHAACVRVLEGEGLAPAEHPGPRVARVRIALTDIAKSTPWQKIHPGARFAGAGTGGAAMEGEVVDSLTGEQLAAVVRADAGNQFNLTAFSTLDDVKSAIDKWAADAAKQLRQVRAAAE